MVAENIVKTGGERRKKTFKKVNFGFESATKIKKKTSSLAGPVIERAV